MGEVKNNEGYESLNLMQRREYWNLYLTNLVNCLLSSRGDDKNMEKLEGEVLRVRQIVRLFAKETPPKIHESALNSGIPDEPKEQIFYGDSFDFHEDHSAFKPDIG